jgi:benzoylformate decarboxylase
MKTKARYALMEFLVRQGVRYIFGNPGTTELPFLDALQDYPQIVYLLSLQENNAVAMADGYARAARRPALVNLHVTGGLANGLAMLYDAFRGGTPLVVTAGQSDTRIQLREPLLYSDMVSLCRPFTKWSAEVRRGADLILALRRAFRIAATPPRGPVFLSLPMDVLDETEEAEPLPPSPIYPRLSPDPQAVAEAVEILAEARHPLILVGDGVAQSQAVGEAVLLAETLGAEVRSLSFSEVNFPMNHPLYRGTFDPDGPKAQEILSRYDVLLVVGGPLFQPFVYRPLKPKEGTAVLHLDINPWELEKNYPIQVGIWGDIRIGLEALDRSLKERLIEEQRKEALEKIERLRSEKVNQQRAYEEKIRSAGDDPPMDPARLFLELREVLPPKTVIAGEAITSTGPMFRMMNFSEPEGYFSLRGGALGWGIGGALGIKLAFPDRPVVAVIGEGSALYGIQGLWTAATYRIPVTYIICNNRSYRILKYYMKHYYLPGQGLEDRQSVYPGMDFKDHPLDCASLAKGFGLRAFQVEDPKELKTVLKEALSSDQPTLVDVALQGGTF